MSFMGTSFFRTPLWVIARVVAETGAFQDHVFATVYTPTIVLDRGNPAEGPDLLAPEVHERRLLERRHPLVEPRERGGGRRREARNCARDQRASRMETMMATLIGEMSTTNPLAGVLGRRSERRFFL
jgi:hypothetical protein